MSTNVVALIMCTSAYALGMSAYVQALCISTCALVMSTIALYTSTNDYELGVSACT